MAEKVRRYDLDWLRAVVVFGLLFFHSAMLFNEWPWHIKNAQVSVLLTVTNSIIGQWQMPILFLISGAGSWFALGFRTGGQYAQERVLRLLVPLAFGMLVIVPPQIYLERISPPHVLAYGHSPLGRFHGSYLQWWPRHMFDGGPYPAGNFSWHHLWFLAYLFVFSMALLPLFLWLKQPAGRAVMARVGAFAGRRGGLFLFILPPMLLRWLLEPISAGQQSLWGDWANLAAYGTLFLYGFAFFADEGFANAFRRYAWPAFGLAIATLLLGVPLALNGYGDTLLMGVLGAVNSWCFLLAWLGLAARYLNVTHRWQPYLNEAVLPFYILHQTVIVVIGYYVIRQPWGIGPKYALVVAASLAVTLAVYDLVVRRLPPLRWLFGMKARAKG